MSFLIGLVAGFSVGVGFCALAVVVVVWLCETGIEE